jgi:assimilatory nitrate reductase catalytic subunit
VRESYGRDGDWIELKDSAARRHRIALLVDGRLEAVAFFERDAARLPPRRWLESLFEKDRLSDAERMALLAGTPGKSAPDAGRTICACFGVGENVLRAAISMGADSVEALGIRLKAGTNCGSCIPELKNLLRQRVVESVAS